jgi:WD40 repeat protein
MRLYRIFIIGLLVLAAVSRTPAQELTERGTFKGYKFRVDRAALSPDGKILAAGGGDTRGGELKLWDVTGGKEIASLPGYTKCLFSLAFSADGKRLVSGGQAGVQLWDVNAHKEIASFKDLQDSAQIVALNRDGTKLAAAGWKRAKLWEVNSGKEIATFQFHIPLSGWPGAALSSDLAILAGKNNQEIAVWDTATGKEKAALSEQRGDVGCMVWSADGKTLIASSCRTEGKDQEKGELKLWDVGSGKERATLPGPFGRILEMTLSPDGKTLALLDSPEKYADANLKIVDVDTGKQSIIRVPASYSFRSPHFTTEGKLLVTGASVDSVRLWEVSLPKKDAKP